MLLHDIPKEKIAIPEWMEGLRVYMAVNPISKIRIHSNLMVEYSYRINSNDLTIWSEFPRENIAGWLTYSPQFNKDNTVWDFTRIEFV